MTLITDFSIAQPADRLIADDSTTFGPISKPKPGAWRLIEYETELFSGRFLQASDREAAVLTVPIDCDGWHAVSIGIAATGVKQGPASIEVRLEGDEHWQHLRAAGWIDYVEEPWIIADLTGRSLQVRFPQQGQGPVLARLCSVRAVPVRDEHVRELQADPPRPLVFTNDGNMFNGAEPGTEVVEQAFRRFAGSPWTMGCYGVGGADIVHYDTKVGNIIGQDAWDSEEGYLGSYDVVTAMIDMGLDPMQVAIDSAHRMGLGLIAYLRVQLWICEPPLDQQFRSRFYAAHPEYCCVEADGVVDHSKLSIAFPEVRGQLNGIMRECLERGADGACLCFARGFPLVRYEQPVLDRYRERYGGDARELDDSDERLRSRVGGDHDRVDPGDPRAAGRVRPVGAVRAAQAGADRRPGHGVVPGLRDRRGRPGGGRDWSTSSRRTRAASSGGRTSGMSWSKEWGSTRGRCKGRTWSWCRHWAASPTTP